MHRDKIGFVTVIEMSVPIDICNFLSCESTKNQVLGYGFRSNSKFLLAAE